MIDSRTRIDCISDGSWNSLSDWEKTEGLIEFSENEYESKDFGSIEAFICWYHRERLTPEDTRNSVYDSPNSDNKENPRDMQK